MRENIPSVISLIGAVFFLVTLPAQVYALTPDQVFDKVKDSIVVVKTLDTQGKVKGFGSGVLLPSGKIATNCHVVEGGISYQVSRGKELVSATLYAEDRDKDICLLNAEGITEKPAQLGKATNLKVGAPVYAVGAPRGLELSLSDGIVAQLRGAPPPLIQTTAAISPGSSGGGLFDGEGLLVGLTTLYIEGGQSLNFAMPVEWVDDVKPDRKQAVGGRSRTEWWKRSIALEELKDWHGSLDWCLKWTESEPKEALAWANLGTAYSDLRRYDDAIGAYRQAIRITPEYPQAWNNLGKAYSDLRRYDDAIGAFHQAIRINPKEVLAWYNLGCVYSTLKRYDDAIEAYRQSIRINPEYANAWTNIGIEYNNLKRYNDAIEAYRQAIRINPNNVSAWYNLGVTYGDLRRNNDSVEAFRQTLHINPEHTNAWYNLAVGYARSGNRTAALEAIKELRRLDPAGADELFNRMVPR